MANQKFKSKVFIACFLIFIYRVDAASLDKSQTVKDFFSETQINASGDVIAKNPGDEEKNARSINVEINNIADDDAVTKKISPSEDPASALNGIYAECLVNLSFPCLQKKVLVFLDRLGRVQTFSLIDGFLSVERINKDTTPSLTESTLSARKFQDENTLKTLIDVYVDRFFENHVIKLNIPAALEETGRSTTLDIKIGDNMLNEGRKKGGGGGGKMKGMKKMMMMMGMMMIMKMSLLGPLMMGLIGIAALKALIFSVISITISKIMILKKLKMMMGSKGGGGGSGHGDSSGWASSGGGSSGWDRSLDSHRLSYSAYAS